MVAAGFSSTLSLGWLIVVVMILIFAGYVGLRDKLGKRWRGLYELADAERKELTAKVADQTMQIAECKATIARLDGLQMPIKIVELMNESVHRIDEMSGSRLQSIIDILSIDRKAQEERDTHRHESLMTVLGEIREVLKQSNGA